MQLPTLYRDNDGNSLPIARLLTTPGVWEYQHDFALDPEPKHANVIGYKNGLPVVLVTDQGAVLDDGDGPYRRTTFRIPGDERVHELCIGIPCTIPQLYRGRCYVVHQVTRETWAAMDPPLSSFGSKRAWRMRLLTAAAALFSRFGVLLPIVLMW